MSIGVLLAAVLGMRIVGPGMMDDLKAMLSEGLAHPQTGEMTTSTAMQLGRDAGGRALLALIPLFAILALAGVALNVAQTGPMLTWSGLSPRLNRVNPGSGLKRIFSAEGLVTLAKALLKMGVVAVVVWLTMAGQMAEISALGTLSIGASSARLAALSFDVALRAALVLFVLSLADYAWQRRRHTQQLRMSREEVKQELRETEGDPQIKAAIRRRRQSLMNRMIAQVPLADVVVTNPTHYAVALKYDPVTMPAPQVLAKGERLLAQRIKEVARKAGVPVLEEPPLARALYAAVPVGRYIPANLFHAVAEVLAWVYALRSKAAAAKRRTLAPQGGL